MERLGYEVLERSYREADLIAACEERLIVCGVRGLGPLTAPCAGNGLQRRRLWRSAAAWLGEGMPVSVPRSPPRVVAFRITVRPWCDLDE